MKHINLEDLYVGKKVKIGSECPYIEPNITEDCILYLKGKPVGFYLSKMPEKASKLAELANTEFNSDRVPKSLLERSDVLKAQSDFNLSRAEARKLGTIQYSTIIGSVPPKPHFRRYALNYSAVHSVKSAQTYIKAMWKLAIESEKIIKEITPNIWQEQNELFKQVPDEWKFGSLFTSSICNYNISAPFHCDTGNIKGAVNVIITKRRNAKGGCLNVPDYDVTFEQRDGSMLVYPAWMSVHGVTPIVPTHEGGYRNSLVFYPLKAFVEKTEK